MVITADLRHALEPQVIVNLLAGIGLVDADMATATMNHARTVRRWKEGNEPNRVSAARLDDLRNIVLVLREAGLHDRAIVLWLRQRNSELGDHRPLDVLGQGAYDHVRIAARAFAGYHQPPTPPLPEEVEVALRSGLGAAAVGAANKSGRPRSRSQQRNQAALPSR